MKSSVFGIALLAFALPFSAGASVKRDGQWPAAEKKVDLTFDGTPSEGLKLLAKEAGWSLVMTTPETVEGAGNVHIAVHEQPADAVLDALFARSDVVALRNGSLIVVTPSGPAPAPAASASASAAASATEAPPAPPPPVPVGRAKDRSILGDDVVVHANETVGTLTVSGGDAKIRGTVSGDLVVLGGDAKVEKGGHVAGKVKMLGGDLDVAKDARVDGDIDMTGGSFHHDEGAIIGGRVTKHGGEGGDEKGDSAEEKNAEEKLDTRSRLAQAAHEFGAAVTRMALLFVLGCVLLALLAPRMDRLSAEIAARPMKSFAKGILGGIAGLISVTILATVLCVTIIGIPVAVLGVLLLVIAVYGAIAAALTTFGAAVIGHRTPNPYLHLLLGCGAFLVLSSIPWIGGAVTFGVVLIGIGALVATRAGGLLDRKARALPT